MGAYAFGVDIGGTAIKMGLFETNGKLLEKWEIPTDTSENGSHILTDIADAMNEKIEAHKWDKHEIIGIGMGVPGPVDEKGNVLKCVNLGWGVFNIEEKMEKLSGIPTKAGNDANVAALGEMYKGGGRGYTNIAMLTLGTGIGGGITIDGKILAGINGAAGEVGHIPMNDEETECCGCGKKGCLEQYASATGIARMAKKKLAESNVDSVLKNDGEITAKKVFDAAKAGDAFAIEQVEELGKRLGKACACIACVCNPQIFVIGGGVSKAGSIVTDVIKKYFCRYAFHAASNTPFALAELGNDAGIYGGVKMVLPE
ncbi:MAG: ROK family glucokinase [Eubacterium sp.]|nr:ROK family glucokinase [Eubacterium sp.]